MIETKEGRIESRKGKFVKHKSAATGFRHAWQAVDLLHAQQEEEETEN